MKKILKLIQMVVLVVVFSALFYIGIELLQTINPHTFVKALPFLAKGMVTSLKISFLSLFLGFGLGTVISLLAGSSNHIMRSLVYVYVSILRGTPMLVQVVFLFYALPAVGIHISAFWCAVIAIGINSSAYISEVIRSGIESVPRGQIEAAQTLGINNNDITQHIILPQALRSVLPALGNEAITLVKDSSIASIIGVMELYKSAQDLMSQTADYLTLLCCVGLFYLVTSTLLSLVMLYLEQKLKIK